MLYFKKDELTALQRPCICHVCRERVATWAAQVHLENGEKQVTWEFCAWCLMYSSMAQWGYDHRAEMLHVGRFALGMAANHGKPVPVLDARDRLSPEDAEKFMLGVSFSSRLMVDRMGHSRGVSVRMLSGE